MNKYDLFWSVMQSNFEIMLILKILWSSWFPAYKIKYSIFKEKINFNSTKLSKDFDPNTNKIFSKLKLNGKTLVWLIILWLKAFVKKYNL